MYGTVPFAFVNDVFSHRLRSIPVFLKMKESSSEATRPLTRMRSSLDKKNAAPFAGADYGP